MKKLMCSGGRSCSHFDWRAKASRAVPLWQLDSNQAAAVYQFAHAAECCQRLDDVLEDVEHRDQSERTLRLGKGRDGHQAFLGRSGPGILVDLARHNLPALPKGARPELTRAESSHTGDRSAMTNSVGSSTSLHYLAVLPGQLWSFSRSST